MAQLVLGIANSGMLMCPMTLAAKQLPPERFGLWSGGILSLGNTGMLLSASPLAYVVEQLGAYAIIVIGVVTGAATLGLALCARYIPLVILLPYYWTFIGFAATCSFFKDTRTWGRTER